MPAELVLFEELVPALVKLFFIFVLDCHKHFDTGPAVPPVAALLRADLPASNICSQL
jgi:hypothetical protein